MVTVASGEQFARLGESRYAIDPRSAEDYALLLEELEGLNRDLEVPSPKAYGIDEARYLEVAPTMAEQALASGSPNNNPRIPSAAEMVALYQQVYA